MLYSSKPALFKATINGIIIWSRGMTVEERLYFRQMRR
jgi:hypothetical protein